MLPRVLPAPATARKPAKPVKAAKRPTRRPSRAPWSIRRKLAVMAGGVGGGVLTLSLYHCTSALVDLTGSPAPLAALLALGIDAGMVACEGCAIASPKDGLARPWAHGYVAGAAALSAALNAYANAQHAPAGLGTALAVVIGLAVPAAVYVLFRVAGAMWE